MRNNMDKELQGKIPFAVNVKLVSSWNETKTTYKDRF